MIQSKTRAWLCVAVVAYVGGAGCATIIDGSTQTMTFDSHPKGAEVVIDGIARGVTPVTMEVERKETHNIVIRKEGYDKHVFDMRAEFNPMFLGNFCTGGLPGSTTDAASGAIHRYSPNSYYFTLEPIAEASDDNRQSWKHDGLKIKVTQFVLSTHGELAREIVSGKGEYLDALYELAKVQPRARETALHELQTLLQADVALPQFAESVAEQLIEG